ncbi:probable G-protein coupled receptor Mth-like 3 [Monomorium pharaonis]|uniref:probable G-protein coupled receptor Mth-like 3 n=1 Tax=Monomorium pharaonis TaxID=307658 RepID=UPI001747BB8E|nr:probable G-protein coupled receptor Mth-like 3 [Monomorium pharaonis]XP_012533519.2 probable G-protein coupled receptor Mth-like 3 [Monomorium pharaonis]XP_012533520.2 probable G-protein coupled receptor Mth-like 3 [Monomorium pharaonis]XP_012533521.2 probable G-protein coupled receptor Mth-like 3 [Monomorium pharaonis]XP_036144888.1 probable G-protein coupled receptor Mth-like 3 [Monomorium pharaonis]XP_036144892.1 probable G-protein coupled receptor Mth-like 3 [Monomorium pharaonis]
MMYPSSIVLWCHVLLLVVLSSDSLGNSTNDELRSNSMARYDRLIDSRNRDDKMQPILYKLRENSTKNVNEMQYEPTINSMTNDRKDSLRYEPHLHIMKIHEENNQISIPRIKSIKMSNENDTTLQELNESLTRSKSNSMLYEYGNFNTDNYNDSLPTVSYEMCGNETCIQLCCPFGNRVVDRKCIAGQDNYSFPYVQNDSKNKKLDELFQLTVRDPCILQGTAHRILNPDEYLFLVNGSLYQNSGKLVPSTSYCLAILDRNIYDTIVCKDSIGFPQYVSVCLLVSLPFLVLTFVVYSILPEVQNIHTYTLRVYVATLFTTNVIIFCAQEIPVLSEWKYCIPLAYIFNISMLASCFWLNAMCFDIWWTFRKLSFHPTNVKDRRRKWIMYSIYAWGLTFGLTIVCAIMDIPGIPKDFIRPEMCVNKFWFGQYAAFSVYYYIPTGIAFISNVCFFVTTAITIIYHNKHTAHQLRDSDNRRYNKRKRKFGMYLKLFVVMGLTWSLGIILWLINGSHPLPQIVWNINYTIDILQGVVIFIIYVCKKKILRLLLKRFGYHDRDPFWGISRSGQVTRTSSNFSSLSSISGSMPMQKINSSFSHQANHHVQPNTK